MKQKYDLSKDSKAGRTKWKSNYSCVYKANDALENSLERGHTYLLEVYSTSGSGKIIEGDFYTYHLAIGEPVLLPGYGTFYGSTSLSIPERKYSDIYTFKIDSPNIPDTALVSEITPADNSGKRPSELVAIEKYRVCNISEASSIWNNCTGFYNISKVTLIPDTQLCTHVKGTWQIQAYAHSKI